MSVFRLAFVYFLAPLFVANTLAATYYNENLAPPQKTPEQYWAEVALPVELLTHTVSNNNCYRDIKAFRGCLAAIREVLLFATPALSLAPETQVNGNPFLDAPVVQWGPLYAAQSRKNPDLEKLSAEDLDKLETSYKKQQLSDFDSLFTARDPQGNPVVDFNDILAWALQKAPLKDKESLITAAAFNEYLGQAENPHNRIETVAELQDMANSTGESFGGVGMSVGRDKNGFFVYKVMPGHPAQEAGLRWRDRIVSIDGVDVTKAPYQQVIDKVRGTVGSKLSLGIERNSKAMTVEITRAEIKDPIVRTDTASDLGPKGPKFGYIRLANFMAESSPDLIANALKDFDQKKYAGVILDLRQNPGGDIEVARRIGSLFLKGSASSPDPIVRVESIDPTVPGNTLSSTNESPYAGPVVVLIDTNSASASELLTGALQDHKRVWVVGGRSFGKGTVQRVGADPTGIMPAEMSSYFQDIAYIKTIARFHVEPSDRSNQLVGIQPDFEAYSTPTPEYGEVRGYHETDEYPNAIPNPADTYVQPRPARQKAIQDCLAKRGSALATYKAREADLEAVYPPDYPVLVAEDVLYCDKVLP